MNPLGYVNLFWLHEFMEATILCSDRWFIETYPEKYDGEVDSYLLAPYQENQRSLNLFIEYGLKVIFSGLNVFQQQLIVDCIAVVIAQDKPKFWNQVNYFDTIMASRISIADEPRPLFIIFYDILSAGMNHSLASYEELTEIHNNTADRLELYQYVTGAHP